MADTRQLAADIAAGNRQALSRAITLVESTLPRHREQALALLQNLTPASGRSRRIGISGAPGVGKSTYIDALGRHMISQGHRLAVLTVDPTSSLSGGSILGDKTRMEHLAHDRRAYIRPSPFRTCPRRCGASNP